MRELRSVKYKAARLSNQKLNKEIIEFEKTIKQLPDSLFSKHFPVADSAYHIINAEETFRNAAEKIEVFYTAIHKTLIEVLNFSKTEMDQMENQIITENELPSIQFKLTDDHRKLINEIRDRIIILKKNKNLSINLQIVPERVSEAFCYIQNLANGSSDVLNLEEICHIHKLLGCSGKLREPASSWFDENNIGVKWYNPPTNESIEPLLSEYVKQYLSVKESDNAFEKICSAYFVFEQIDPFGDGNGRTGRIICAWMMFKYGYGFSCTVH